MTQAQLIEGVTHIGLLVLYTIALGVGWAAWSNSAGAARQRSALAICIVAVGWLIFYGGIAEVWPFRTANPNVLWSRAFHYVTASALIFMALTIRNSEQQHRALLIHKANGEDV